MITYGVIYVNNTKKLIFEAAINIFSNCGYSGATMDDISLKAGVAKGTLYYHFKSKEDIFNFTISEGMDVIKEEIEALLLVDQNPIEKLKALCKLELKLVYKNRDFFKVVLSQLWGKETRQQELREAIHNHIKCFEKFIVPAMEGGYIRNAEPTFIAYNIFGTMCSSAVYELINKSETSMDDTIEELMNYILKGIGI